MQVSFMRQISLINPTLEVPMMPDSTEIFYWINYGQQKYLKEMYISKACEQTMIHISLAFQF